jgi:DNA-binding transcriptional ArsR family regulator
MIDIRILTALGEPTRLRLFQLILEGPRSVGELVKAVAVTQPAVSQHLKVLRAAGLVTVDRRGAQRIYRALPEALAELNARIAEWLKRFGPKATA